MYIHEVTFCPVPSLAKRMEKKKREKEKKKEELKIVC